MELFLIRHGQSANNLNFALTNSYRNRVDDPELTELGRKQADAFADHAARDTPFTHLYTSLMTRAVTTADVIGSRLGIKPVAWPDVHECKGIFLRNEETGDMVGQAGKPRSFFERRFPGLTLPDGLDERGWWNRPVETPDQWVARSRRFLAELRRRHAAQDDRVAVVTHGDFYRQVLSELFDISAVSGIHFRLSNTAVSRIDIVGDRTDVHFLNRTDHLGADLAKEVF